ncbi:MAG: alpha/beta fold hydrolase [Gammaproteobacteria bacterium]|nr:alpha/beta fold hydrolase [Gammaproteobacteria bacterium]MYB36623.1 alpha/beta fold hydrolase [Gammaproteobacteria bacterium]
MTQIAGPAGVLELAVDERGGDCALLCHPHPLYGGSLHDAVLGLAEEAWQRQGGSSIRFNFRGVGASEGSFDGGDGEAEDAACVANWARATLGARTLTLLGYSFGAGVAWRTAAELDDIAQIVLVAPPMPSMDFPHRIAPPTVLIHGDQDDFVDAAFATKWAADQESARLITLQGADHFFSGAANALAAAFDTAFGARKGSG